MTSVERVAISLHLLICFGAVLSAYEYWTPWFSRDRPSGYGDSETRHDLGKSLTSCPFPNEIECQTTSGKPYHQTGQTFDKGFDCNPMLGLVCINKFNKGGCYDYKTRYRCNTGGSSNQCTINNGLCSHMCNYCTNCGGRWCSCFSGYSLMNDYKTCNEPLRCFECSSSNDPTRCGKITKTDHTSLQLPCNTMCYTARDWNGIYHRGCADTNPKYPNRCIFSDRIWNYRPPASPGTHSWHHPGTSSSTPNVHYVFCKGDLCNGNGGSAKIIKGFGSLTSQNFPLNYHNNILTTYVIHAVHRMKITFSHFSIEYHRTCYFDSLTLRNGEYSWSPLIGKYCDGNRPPSTIVTSGTKLYVQFRTDYSVTRTGFRMVYTRY